MGYAPSALQECPDIQVELNNYFENCASANLVEGAPLYDFLLSPVNRGNYSQVVSPGQGKLKNIVYRYDQRILEAEVTQPGSCERSCVATTKRGDLTGTCTIDPCDFQEVEELIGAQDFTYACRNNFDIVNTKLMMMMSVLERKMATQLTAEAIALIGTWNSLVTPVTNDFLQVQTLKTGSTDVNPAAFVDIDMAIKQTQYCAPPAIFAGATLNKYYRLMQAGCCSNQGLNLEEIMSLYGMAVMYDYRVQQAFADVDKSIVIQPGSVQVVTYNENDNGIAEAAGVQWGANYYKRVIISPRTGLPIDLTLSDNCGNLSIFMRANAKICGLPDDLFAPGDPMEGVVYVNGIEVANS